MGLEGNVEFSNNWAGEIKTLTLNIEVANRKITSMLIKDLWVSSTGKQTTSQVQGFVPYWKGTNSSLLRYL